MADVHEDYGIDSIRASGVVMTSPDIDAVGGDTI